MYEKIKVRNYVDVNTNFKAGDIVWACAYTPTSNKEEKYCYCKPIKGRLMPYNREHLNDKLTDLETNPEKYDIAYFIPFKKNGIGLAYSKAVSMFARCYANTKEACDELYKELITEQIDWHKAEIKKLEAEIANLLWT